MPMGALRLTRTQVTTRIIGAHPSIRVVVYSVFDSDETQHAARQAAPPRSSPSTPHPIRSPVLAAWQAASTPNPPAAPPSEDPR
jgi:hypothetical protein